MAGSGLGCMTGLLIRVSAGEEELPTAMGCEGVLRLLMASAPMAKAPPSILTSEPLIVGSSTGGEQGLDEDIAVLRTGRFGSAVDNTLFSERLISWAVEVKLELGPPRSLEGSR